MGCHNDEYVYEILHQCKSIAAYSTNITETVLGETIQKHYGKAFNYILSLLAD